MLEKPRAGRYAHCEEDGRERLARCECRCCVVGAWRLELGAYDWRYGVTIARVEARREDGELRRAAARGIKACGMVGVLEESLWGWEPWA